MSQGKLPKTDLQETEIASKRLLVSVSAVNMVL
jgi:hypothetical protein